MSPLLKTIATLFFVAAGVAAVFGVYLFWDGLIDVINYIQADQGTLPTSMIAWALVRVLGFAEFIGVGGFWAFGSLGVLTFAISED